MAYGTGVTPVATTTGGLVGGGLLAETGMQTWNAAQAWGIAVLAVLLVLGGLVVIRTALTRQAEAEAGS